MADFLDRSACIDFEHGDYQTASGVIDEAVALARQDGGALLIAQTLTHRGLVTSSLDPDQARANFGEALSISREMGDHSWLQVTLECLGCLELLLGNIDEGRSYLEECVSIGRGLLRSEEPNALLSPLMNLALATIMQGDIASTFRLQDESLRLCQEIGALRDFSYFVLGVALCMTISGEMELAMTLHGAADGLIEQMDRSFQPLEEELREQDHSRLRQAMGETAFESAYAAGRRLTSSEAIELAEQSIQRLREAPSRACEPK